MAKQYIELFQSYDAPISWVFQQLTDHENFGKLVNAKVTRIVDASGKNKNGLGAVRRIEAFPVPAFEETVTAFKNNELMEYSVTKGTPVKNHKGRIAFVQVQGKTIVHYTIELEPKLPIPFTGLLLKAAAEIPIRLALKKLARQQPSEVASAAGSA